MKRDGKKHQKYFDNEAEAAQAVTSVKTGQGWEPFGDIEVRRDQAVTIRKAQIEGQAPPP